MVSAGVITTLVILGFISTIFLILLMVGFGRLIWLQLRIWLLSKRGYHLVEHVGEDNVRRYYYLRPKDDHFDVNDGFYLYMPDSVTKQTAILKKFKKEMAKGVVETGVPQGFLEKLNESQQKEYIKRYEAEKLEAKKYHDTVNKLNYSVDAVTLRYGIPTITYYGNESEPINFKKKNKLYDAKTLKDLFLRILLTQKYGFFKKWIIIAIISMVFTSFILLLFYIFFNTQGTEFSNSLGICLSNLNVTSDRLVQCTGNITRIMSQNSTIII